MNIPNKWKNKIHVPNHQPDIIWVSILHQTSATCDLIQFQKQLPMLPAATRDSAGETHLDSHGNHPLLGTFFRTNKRRGRTSIQKERLVVLPSGNDCYIAIEHGPVEIMK